MNALWLENNAISSRNVPKPKKKNEALIKIRKAGICSTDLELVKGYYPYTGVLGHEFVGDVIKADDASWIGARVVGEINAVCDQCEQCLNGRPRFGPRIRFLSIITNAPLKSGKPLKKDFCNNCALCIKACPVGAIDQNGNVDVMKCAKENMKLGLPGVTQFVKRWIPASEDEKKTMLKSPTFWEIWQNVTTGIFYYCFECLNACPVGKRR